ncbi:MAG: carboxypeptidase regulatory-like domain-containing protein [Chloroflexia bacterium]|nr:carboxypeptidase regulatory-like domain-containing protein [Chloroflexia bacterium]
MSESIIFALADADNNSATLYTMHPDGSGAAELFSFAGHPRDPTGLIWHPRLAADGRSLYFSSDHAYLYTPAGRNIFCLDLEQKRCEQLTPGPHSGRWDQGGPYGTVKGRVLQENGLPWAGGPVFLEGQDMRYADADGRFVFERVPEGERWLVAYRPGSTAFDAQMVPVVAGTTFELELAPRSDYRSNFEHPLFHQGRLYYRQDALSLQWARPKSTTVTEVYRAAGGGSGLPLVGGFDLASHSGRLAIVDYVEGCPTNRGLYLADLDGNNISLFLDMKADFNWCGAQEVFWSPDERRLALKACYNWATYLLVYDAAAAAPLGSIYFDPNYTIHNVALHGWSPDGRWLLCSHWLGRPAAAVLSRVPVGADGSINPAGVQHLLQQVNLCGATWGIMMSTSDVRQNKEEKR